MVYWRPVVRVVSVTLSIEAILFFSALFGRPTTASHGGPDNTRTQIQCRQRKRYYNALRQMAIGHGNYMPRGMQVSWKMLAVVALYTKIVIACSRAVDSDSLGSSSDEVALRKNHDHAL